MRRLFIIICIVIATVPTLAAQIEQRDYAIIGAPSIQFSEDESEFTLEFRVQNLGGSVEDDTTVRVFMLDGQAKRQVGQDTIAPLETLAPPAVVRFTFESANFPPGSQVPLLIEVGLDEESGPLALNNTASISASIPAGAGQPDDNEIRVTPGEPAFTIPILNIPIDFSDPSQVVVLAGVGFMLLLLLWFLSIILRLIFNRPAKFGRWQPPYANLGYYDPNSTPGIRQQWQAHAQNGALLAICTEGYIHPVKQFLGMDGVNMSGWKLVAMRMSQYDMYGRVSRSEALTPRGLVKKLDKLAHKGDGLDMEQMRKKVAPVAKGLVKQFKKNINQRSAMLPVALDIRFEGRHGEVRIQFILYRCENSAWQEIDRWEPEMTVVGRTIQESYTYTIHGQQGGETLKEFRQRLQDDLTWVLAEMLYHRREVVSKPSPDNVVPDTLTGMEPVRDKG